MDTLPPQLLIVMLVVVTILGFLTSLVKSASIDINDTKLLALAEENKKAKKLCRLLEKNPSATISSLDLVADFFGFLFAAISVLEFIPFGKSLAENFYIHILSILVLVVCINFVFLVFWKLVPEKIGAKYADGIAVAFATYTKFIAIIGKPLLILPTFVSNIIARIFGVNPHDIQDEVTEEEIRMMVDIGSEKGTIDDDEKEMIHNIFELDDKIVEDIMTHRTEACILWKEETLDEWKSFIDETRHTRYPVCDEDVDNVIGIINSRDFYRFMLEGGVKENLSDIIRAPHFVPDSMKADELFSRMQKMNTHMVVVMDEYGGFRGLATQEDLLEEIVGELYSEYEEPELDLDITLIDENTWRIKGSTEISNLEKELNIDLPEGDYNTFAGLILEAIETIPEDGETVEVEVGSMQIKVTSVADHRIEEAIVCLNRDVSEGKDEETED